jgi:ABC-type glycerol-3-phosphate transport system permease component
LGRACGIPTSGRLAIVFVTIIFIWSWHRSYLYKRKCCSKKKKTQTTQITASL